MRKRCGHKVRFFAGQLYGELRAIFNNQNREFLFIGIFKKCNLVKKNQIIIDSLPR
jgi:hypothetical protein